MSVKVRATHLVTIDNAQANAAEIWAGLESWQVDGITDHHCKIVVDDWR